MRRLRKEIGYSTGMSTTLVRLKRMSNRQTDKSMLIQAHIDKYQRRLGKEETAQEPNPEVINVLGRGIILLQELLLDPLI